MAEPATLLLIGTGFVGIAVARGKLRLAYRVAHQSFRQSRGLVLSLLRNKVSWGLRAMRHRPAAP